MDPLNICVYSGSGFLHSGDSRECALGADALLVLVLELILHKLWENEVFPPGANHKLGVLMVEPLRSVAP